MRRRGFLRYLAGGLGIGGGYWGLENGHIPGVAPGTVPDLSLGPPPTETPIGEKTVSTHGKSPFQKITFYESGAAEVLFESDHNIDRFGFTHSDLKTYGNSFDTWETPQFEGPKVIDMKSLVVRNGPYPSNNFKISVYFDPTEAVYFGVEDMGFAVPKPWYRKGNEQ